MIHLGLEGNLPTLLYIGMFVAFLGSIFWRPSVGLYLLAFSLPLQTGRYKLHGFFLGAQFIDILLLGVVIGLVLRHERIIANSPIAKFLIALTAFYYFSLWEGSFFMDMPLPLWITDTRFSDWKNYVEMFFIALVTAGAIKNKRQVYLLLIVMGLSLLVVNRNYYSIVYERDVTHFSYALRDAGVMGYAGENGLAAFEVMMASFLFGIYAFATSKLVKVVVLGLLVTCSYCLLFSYSRGGYLGFLAGLLVIGLLKERKALILAAALLLAWETLLPVSVQERINMTRGEDGSGTSLDSSSAERVELWQDALQMIKANPVTGTGFNTYEFMGRVGPYRDTHNYYLKVCAETGFVGFALFLVLLYKLHRLGHALYRQAQDPFWKSIGLGFFTLMASAVVVNVFGDRWTYQQVDGYLWIILGCVLRGLLVESEETEVTVPERDMADTEPVLAGVAGTVVISGSPGASFHADDSCSPDQ